MATIVDLKEELNELTTLKLISSALTEASSAKLKKIRGLFEKNQEFFEEIRHVYHLVRVNAIRQGIKDSTPTAQSERSLAVAITANQHFYGNQNQMIMKSFTTDLVSGHYDVLVIGTTGFEYMNSQGRGISYEKMTFAQENPTEEETKKFLDYINPYGKVVIYYPKFVTLLQQTVGIIDITESPKDIAAKASEEEHVLFEPELDKINAFFQRSVRTLLFLRVMLETDLSRTASRLIAMSAAEERSEEMVHEKRSQIRKLQTSFINAQLLETFAGMEKWKN